MVVLPNFFRGKEEQRNYAETQQLSHTPGCRISGGSRKFWWGGGFKHKTSKIQMSSPKLRVIFRPKSEIQTFFSPKIRWSPKKKRSSPKLRVIFRPKSLGLGWWGGDASRNGAELFEIEAGFSAEIVTFRLVGGMHPPHPPPLNPPLCRM